jgi:hypothetical protein
LALESLAGWTWDPFDDSFGRGLRHLQAYISEHHTSRVPRAYNVDGFVLGAWCDRRRIDYAAGRLTRERVSDLEAQEGWEWRLPEADYDRMFSALEEFVQKTGHAKVPRAHIEDGHRLGAWVSRRRRDYAGGRLSSEHTEQLSAFPGWRWSTPR